MVSSWEEEKREQLSVYPQIECYSRERVLYKFCFPIKMMMTVSSVHMDPGSESERLGLGLWGISLGQDLCQRKVAFERMVVSSLVYPIKIFGPITGKH